MFRGLLLAAAAGLALAAADPGFLREAQAQMAVTCTNCSQFTQQILVYARQLYQLQQEIQTATNTLNFYLNAVQNTASLPANAYQDITGVIANIQGIAQQASMLSGTTGTMIGNIGTPGGYPMVNANTYLTQVEEETAAVANAMRQVGTLLNLQPSQLQNSSATLAALEAQAASSNSRNAILQALAGTTATTGQLVGTQLSTLSALMQAQLTAQTAAADREAYKAAYTAMEEQAALQADCAAAASVGASPPACQNLGAGAATTPVASAGTGVTQ
jgi:P-type conjugative transfer protein TrbJ